MLPQEREPVSLRGVIIQPLGVPSDGPLCSLWRGTDFLAAELKSVTAQYNYILCVSVCVQAWCGDLSSAGALVKRKCSRVLYGIRSPTAGLLAISSLV